MITNLLREPRMSRQIHQVQPANAFDESFLLLAAVCGLATVAAWQLRDSPAGDPPAQ